MAGPRRGSKDLGFPEVYFYDGGKSDWFANGGPRAGLFGEITRLGDLAEEAPSCAPDERVGTAADRARDAGWDACAVTGEGGIVIGLLRSQLRGSPPEAVARDVMHNGPRTWRPDEFLPEAIDYMSEHRLESTLVTYPDGRLMGMVRLSRVKGAIKDVRKHLAAIGHLHEE